MTELFNDILGHSRVKQGLLHATCNDRLHHALLFVGPEGIGKGMLAKAFVQMWLCCNSTESAPARCLQCPNCKRIADKTHPDVIEYIEESASIKIETIRNIQHRLIYPPYEAPHRYIILHDVHKMQDAAANCLLKTLEEPDKDTTFILITSQIQRLLPTIISRCQTVRFAPFAMEEIASFLVKTKNIPQELATQIAAISNGGLAAAIALCDGEYKNDLVNTFNEIISMKSILDAFSTASALKGKKAMAPHILLLLSMFIRDMTVLKQSPNTPIMLKHYMSEMQNRISSVSDHDLQRAFHITQEINEGFLGNLNELIVWERLCAGMHGVIF